MIKSFLDVHDTKISVISLWAMDSFCVRIFKAWQCNSWIIHKFRFIPKKYSSVTINGCLSNDSKSPKVLSWWNYNCKWRERLIVSVWKEISTPKARWLMKRQQWCFDASCPLSAWIIICRKIVTSTSLNYLHFMFAHLLCL